jgi:hypothetical protein
MKSSRFPWLLLACLCSVLLAPGFALGQDLPIATPVDPASVPAAAALLAGDGPSLAGLLDWAQLKDTLLFRHGGLNGLLAWMAASRAFFKLVNGRLESALQSFIAFWVRQKDDEMVDRIERFLTSRPYRLAAFCFDYFLSWKLPLRVDREAVETLRIQKN